LPGDLCEKQKAPVMEREGACECVM